jgi:hypothetical protein
MMKELSKQATEKVFTNHSAYFRYLLTQHSKDESQKEIVNKDNELEKIDLESRLQELERKIDEIKTQVKVNEQALMVLLAFFDIEKIPVKGLDNARKFLAKKALEIGARG